MSLAAPLQVGDAFADVSMRRFGVVLRVYGDFALATVATIEGAAEKRGEVREIRLESNSIAERGRDMIAEYEVR